MKRTMLHVFRNTPLGRETLLHSLHFCRQTDLGLLIYVPTARQFLMYFADEIATIDLDESYLRNPETAREHAAILADKSGVRYRFIEPTAQTAPTLPDLPTSFAAMTCPRSMSEMSHRIRLGHIGPKVRQIIRYAPFEVLLPVPIFKPWASIVCCYGGSHNADRALATARRLQDASGCALTVFTLDEGRGQAHYRQGLERAGLGDALDNGDVEWLCRSGGRLSDHLYAVPHDALVVAGAYGHGRLRDVLFGSTLEKLQNELPNNLLIVGPALQSDADRWASQSREARAQ